MARSTEGSLQVQVNDDAAILHKVHDLIGQKEEGDTLHLFIYDVDPASDIPGWRHMERSRESQATLVGHVTETHDPQWWGKAG